MTASVPILIDAIAEEVERPIYAAAVAQLRDCLAAAGGETPWHIEVRFRRSVTAIDRQAPPAAIIVSLLAETARPDEHIALTEARWRSQLTALDAGLVPSTFLCTIFRAVRGARADRASAPALALIERIRRINLMAIDLSHDIGVNIIDIDRTIAHIGAQEIGSGYRLSGPLAEEAAGYAIVAALLNMALDELVPPEVLERAKRAHGPVWDLPSIVERRVARRRSAHAVG
jgi:hypothetical protein